MVHLVAGYVTPGTKTLFRDCPLTYKPVLFCSANRLIEVIYGSSTCSHRQFQLYASSPPSTIALSLEPTLRDILHVTTIWYSNGAMAEWSKAVDLSYSIYSTGEIRVGSNPTGTIMFLMFRDRFIFPSVFVRKSARWATLYRLNRLNRGMNG